MSETTIAPAPEKSACRRCHAAPRHRKTSLKLRSAAARSFEAPGKAADRLLQLLQDHAGVAQASCGGTRGA